MTYHQQSEMKRQMTYRNGEGSTESRSEWHFLSYFPSSFAVTEWQLAILISRVHILTSTQCPTCSEHCWKPAIFSGHYYSWTSYDCLPAHLYVSFSYSLWILYSFTQSKCTSLSVSFYSFSFVCQSFGRSISSISCYCFVAQRIVSKL